MPNEFARNCSRNWLLPWPMLRKLSQAFAGMRSLAIVAVPMVWNRESKFRILSTRPKTHPIDDSRLGIENRAEQIVVVA